MKNLKNIVFGLSYFKNMVIHWSILVVNFIKHFFLASKEQNGSIKEASKFGLRQLGKKHQKLA